MPLDAVCPNCSRPHRVDSKLLGKKIRCKACSNPFVVTGLDELPTASAPPAFQPAAAPKSAIPVEPPPDDLPQLPELEPLPQDLPDAQPDAATAPPPPAAHPPCPSCGQPLPAGNRLCIACGYNRASGLRVSPAIAAAAPMPPASRFVPRSADRQHDSQGVRLWRPYDNPLLDFFDTYVPKFALLLYVLFCILAVVSLIRATPAGASGLTIGAITILILFNIVGCLLFYFLVLPITLMGVKIAGQMMKFEVPEEDGPSRLLATQMIALTPTLIVLIVGFVAAGISFGSEPHATSFLGIGLAAIAGAIITYLLAALASFLIFFHLEFIEGIVGYLMMVLFFLIGSAVAGLIQWVVAYVLLTIFTKAAQPL